MRHADVVAGGHHAVMGAECLVTLRLILDGIAFQVAEGGGQTVATVLARRTAESPEGILYSLSQGHETLAPEYHRGVLPAGKRQAKVIKPVRERLAIDADPELRGIGKV